MSTVSELLLTLFQLLEFLICAVFLSLIVIAFFVYSANPNVKHIDKSIKSIVVVYVSLYFIQSLIVAIDGVYDNFSLYITNGTSDIIIDASKNFFHVFGHISFHVLMVARLHQTFNETTYATRDWILYLLLFIAFIMSLLHFAVDSIFFAYDLDIIGDVCLAIFIISNFVFSSSVIWLFVQKLFQLVVDSRGKTVSFPTWHTLELESNTGISDELSTNHSNTMFKFEAFTNHLLQNPDSSKTNTESINHVMSEIESNLKEVKTAEVELSQKQIILVHVITKNTLLCVYAIIFRNLSISGLLLIHILGGKESDTIEVNRTPIILLLYFLLDVCLLIELSCVYLTFKFVEKYYKCLCQKQHQLCHRACQYYTQRQVLDADLKTVRSYVRMS